jgi:NADPH2:quinone reductase
MQAMAMPRFGEGAELQLLTLDDPVPADNEVLIEVAYAGVNPADWKDCAGMLAAFNEPRFPYVPGFDASGRIKALGAGVQGFALGDRVVTPGNHGQGYNGSYASQMLASADRLARVPESFPLQTAAAVPVPALTAWQALFDADRGNLRALAQNAPKVFINGASGAVGTFACQFAKASGASVAGNGGSRLPLLQELGLDCVLDYRAEDYLQSLQAWAGEGIDLIIDTAGGASLPELEGLLKAGGMLVTVSTLVYDQAQCERHANRSYAHTLAFMSDTACGAHLQQIIDRLAAGECKSPLTTVFSLPEAGEAHKRVREGSAEKYVLAVNAGL